LGTKEGREGDGQKRRMDRVKKGVKEGKVEG